MINLDEIKPPRLFTPQELHELADKLKKLCESHARHWEDLTNFEPVLVNSFPENFGPVKFVRPSEIAPVKIKQPVKIYNSFC